MGGALRRLEAPPHEVATFSVDLWPCWERDSDHQSSSGNGANQQEFHKSPTEPSEEYKNVDAVNDLGCFIAELVRFLCHLLILNAYFEYIIG